jgi:hypothetical protein
MAPILIFVHCSSASLGLCFFEQETANRCNWLSTRAAEAAEPRLPPYAAAWPLPKIHSALPSMQSLRKSCQRIRSPYLPNPFDACKSVAHPFKQGCDLQHNLFIAVLMS